MRWYYSVEKICGDERACTVDEPRLLSLDALLDFLNRSIGEGRALVAGQVIKNRSQRLVVQSKEVVFLEILLSFGEVPVTENTDNFAIDFVKHDVIRTDVSV